MTTPQLLTLIAQVENEAYERNKALKDKLSKSVADVAVMQLVNSLKRMINENK